MAFKNIDGTANGGKQNLFKAIKQTLGSPGFQSVAGAESFGLFSTALESVTGTESATFTSTLKGNIDQNRFDAFHGASSRKFLPRDEIQAMELAVKEAPAVAGLEGFSLQQTQGDELELKAINTTLNTQSHLQTAAAEELFKTITVAYEQEGVALKVRAAGLGNYAYGNSAWQSASELRPIFGLLRTGEMYKDEVLTLHPVYSEAVDNHNDEVFVDSSIIAPQPANYPEGDAFGRQSHLTQYLRVPQTIPNFLGLTQVPGQRPWTSTDEIESNSITVRSILVQGRLGGQAGADVAFFVNTTAMSNNAFGPLSNGQSSDDRGVKLHLRQYPGFSVLDKDGNPIGETLFADFKAAGYEPLLNIGLDGNFQRQTNELRLSGGSAEITGLRDIANNVVITTGRATTTQRGLIKQLRAAVTGVKTSQNMTNISRGTFGYRIEVFDAIKHMSVRRGSPISVKYPVTAEDVNQDALNFAIEQMSIVINNQASRKAFDVAQEHLRYITSIDGAPVVGNQQGSNVLPGQHFVTAAAVNRSIKLRDAVMVTSNVDLFDAVGAALANEISDIIAALNTKSGLAAISEYGGREVPEWSVIVHQNMARFLMRTGDVRFLGQGVKWTPFETNFDSQIGQILIVPKNKSTADQIDPLGGIGINVSKENIVVKGNVTRDNQDFGVVMTMPTYRHWPLCPIIGSLTIEDAAEFLGNEGILTGLARLRVSVDGLVPGLAGVEDAVRTQGGEEPTPPNP